MLSSGKCVSPNRACAFFVLFLCFLKFDKGVIFLFDQTNHGKTLTVSILSLSLLTVMAGAAVAPALGVIQAHFSDTNPLLIFVQS